MWHGHNDNDYNYHEDDNTDDGDDNHDDDGDVNGDDCDDDGEDDDEVPGEMVNIHTPALKTFVFFEENHSLTGILYMSTVLLHQAEGAVWVLISLGWKNTNFQTNCSFFFPVWPWGEQTSIQVKVSK